MKIALLLASVILFDLVSSAADSKTLDKLTPAEREARLQASRERRRARAKKSGGYVECPEAIPSKVISVINNQSLVSVSRLSEDIKAARFATRIPIALDAKERIAATISLNESDDAPTLLIAPEDFAVKINVKRLALDAPGPDKLAERLRKEIIRGTLMVLGSGYSPGRCFVSPVSSLKDLDAIVVERPSPETMMHLQSCGRFGVNSIRFASYRTACQEGWASEPTTVEQRQVWDEVHAMPQKPITIEPESMRKK